MAVHQLSQEVKRVSRRYAETFGIERDAPWFALKLQEEMGELIQAYLMLIGKARAKGMAPEEPRAAFHKKVADVFCHILLSACH
jgi:hypothetical protein